MYYQQELKAPSLPDKVGKSPPHIKNILGSQEPEINTIEV